jgi:hypothetical protein
MQTCPFLQSESSTQLPGFFFPHLPSLQLSPLGQSASLEQRRGGRHLPPMQIKPRLQSMSEL